MLRSSRLHALKILNRVERRRRVFPTAISESLSSKRIAKAPAREVLWRKERLDESRRMKPWIHDLIHSAETARAAPECARTSPKCCFWIYFLYLRDSFPFPEQTNVGYMLSLRGIPQLSIRRNASFPRETNSFDITPYLDARYVSLEDAFLISRQSQFLMSLTLWLTWLLINSLSLFLTLIVKLSNLSEKSLVAHWRQYFKRQKEQTW